MSTRAIRKALEMMDLDYAGTEEARDAALAEVEAIEKAAKVTAASVRLAATAAGAEAQKTLESIAKDAPK